MRGSIADLQALSTAGRVGGVQQPNVSYNDYLRPPVGQIVPTNIAVLTNPAAVPVVINGTFLNSGLQIPTPLSSKQLNSTVGKLGGNPTLNTVS